MEKKMFISDIFDIDKEIMEHGNKIFLIAGVGSGKSTWVKEILTKKGNVLFVTSRKAKVSEDINCSCFSDLFKWFTENNQTLVTNAKLSKLIENISRDNMKTLDDFLNHFDYIVIDEIHSMATDSAFAEYCPEVQSFIEYVSQKNKPIITMTGTPEPVMDYFTKNSWYILDYREKCNYVHPQKIVLTTKRSVQTQIVKNWNNKTIIYFSNSTDSIIDLCTDLINERGKDAQEIGIIVSRTKEKEFNKKLDNSKLEKDAIKILKDVSKHAYDEIINNSKIPDECKILISTSTLREGVDIKNESVVMFCENHIMSNLIQFFGRARGNDTSVFVIEDTKPHQIIHQELLYKYAKQEECDALNKFLENYINVKGNAFCELEKFELIKYSKNNPYIYFDYIRGCFKTFDLKYKEEERLLSIYDWKLELIEHCNRYNIAFIGVRDLSKLMQEALERLCKMDKEILSKDKDKFFNILNKAYGITQKQPSKINNEFIKLNLNYRLIIKKGTSGKLRNKQYWKLVLKEDVESK